MNRETFDGYSDEYDGYASPFSSMNVSTLTLLLRFNGAGMLIFLGSLKKNLNTYYPVLTKMDLRILHFLCPWIIL